MQYEHVEFDMFKYSMLYGFCMLTIILHALLFFLESQMRFRGLSKVTYGSNQYKIANFQFHWMQNLTMMDVWDHVYHYIDSMLTYSDCYSWVHRLAWLSVLVLLL